jgi:hypothetical protein
MVIRLNLDGNNDAKSTSLCGLRCTNSSNKKAGKAKRNTEYKRLKTILPSIKRKDNVSKLDIILEAIKYIDDLTDQLGHRLDDGKGNNCERATAAATKAAQAQREAVMALAVEVQRTANAGGFSDECPDEDNFSDVESMDDDEEEEDEEEEDEDLEDEDLEDDELVTSTTSSTKGEESS